jgi:peptidoglycan/LPS O-acetylase OafA/YrhL
MRSSSGQHFIALDHLRALAAFMVIAWHFLHFNNGTPVPFEGAPTVVPLALFDEGHTGVALFMVLSGYLFAKLLDGRTISYSAFFWNRFIRLTPLLLVTFILVGVEQHIRGGNAIDYFSGLYRGLVYPVWPNGGWSITTEIHFYLALPLLLYLSGRSRLLPMGVIVIALGFRIYYFKTNGEVQSIAYWTIAGRIDQFLLGIIAFSYANQLAKNTKVLFFVFLAFMGFWWWFDATGGFYLRPKYPSPSSVWIWLPTFEGFAYAALIVWYDAKRIDNSTIMSRILQRLGEYSYSIYLLHFFLVFRVAKYIDTNLMDISNFYVALAWSIVFFLAMLIPGYLSFRFIERPFLKLRIKYTTETKASRIAIAPGAALYIPEEGS